MQLSPLSTANIQKNATIKPLHDTRVYHETELSGIAELHAGIGIPLVFVLYLSSFTAFHFKNRPEVI